ncbi:unnamed protein product [Dibothriocephalus latus]|uniref:Translocator protein n=1 Tax=Dibothriocephalus latus TaxID=60516 RepID=A0A3P7RDH7_DIBLA|nr:unnamed protein product [Dibothriocephalus latus]
MQYDILVACIGTPFIGTLFGPWIVNKNKAWYHSLKHPSFTPPDWVFGPAWTILYGLMGAASYLVAIEHAQQDVRLPLAVYGINLLLNWSWTPVFFGMHRLKTVRCLKRFFLCMNLKQALVAGFIAYNKLRDGF